MIGDTEGDRDLPPRDLEEGRARGGGVRDLDLDLLDFLCADDMESPRLSERSMSDLDHDENPFRLKL